MGKSDTCKWGTDGVKVDNNECNLLWDGSCAPQECCWSVEYHQLDNCGSHFIEKGQDFQCNNTSPFYKTCVPGRGGVCSPEECCEETNQHTEDFNCVNDFIELGQDYRCDEGLAGVKNIPCEPVWTQYQGEQELDYNGSVVIGACKSEVCCAQLVDHEVHVVGDCTHDFKLMGKSHMCEHDSVLEYARCDPLVDGSCSAEQCCEVVDTFEADNCDNHFSELGQSHLCVDGHVNVDTQCTVGRDGVCLSSECCVVEEEFETGGDCVNDFILTGEADVCEHGMAGVWNRACLPFFNDYSLVDGSCDKEICCQKVADGNCADNFLHVGKEYLCSGGVTGVLTYANCKLDKMGECESSECCIDIDNDFSYKFEDGPDF